MDRNEFFEFMEKNFELNCISLNLLGAIYDYATENNTTKYNWTLDEMLSNAFGDDITDEEMKRICTVEE